MNIKYQKLKLLFAVRGMKCIEDTCGELWSRYFIPITNLFIFYIYYSTVSFEQKQYDF